MRQSFLGKGLLLVILFLVWKRILPLIRIGSSFLDLHFLFAIGFDEGLSILLLNGLVICLKDRNLFITIFICEGFVLYLYSFGRLKVYSCCLCFLLLILFLQIICCLILFDFVLLNINHYKHLMNLLFLTLIFLNLIFRRCLNVL